MGDERLRITREKRTVEAMMHIYCSARHGAPEGLCQECRDLLQYAFNRLEKCPFQEDKPTCADCPIHCYRPSMREEIRAVMSYSGPRMLFRRPILAVQHVIDGLRKAPD
jgi:predicted amidophosphoribosyltransferase